MTEWVTSDLHFFHKNIMKFCPETRPWQDKHEMNEALIDEWNLKVNKNDRIYFFGDFSFGKPTQTEGILKQLNGKKVFLLGNHDQNYENLFKEYAYVADYLSFKRNKIRLVFFHYPIARWHGMEQGAINLHGHCVDEETEILTENGFKFRSDLSQNDVVGTMNPNTHEFEWNNLRNIYDVSYTGKVYMFENKSLSQRVTAEHRIPYKKENNEYDVNIAKDLYKNVLTKIPFFNSCENQNESGINISHDFLKLYIAMCADATIKNETNLVRFRLKKNKKINYIKNILNNSGIDYKEHSQKNDIISLNFYMPKELQEYKIKGMDNFLLECNKEQFESIIEAISNTDGQYDSRSDSVFFYTSKKTEVDIIQACAIKNGFMCNYNTRIHGFSHHNRYSLYIKKTEKRTSNVPQNKVKMEQVNQEDFWCVTVDNGNFFIRRNGKISLTGNCHGSFNNGPNSLDVGYDSLGNIVKLDEAIEIAKEKDLLWPK